MLHTIDSRYIAVLWVFFMSYFDKSDREMLGVYWILVEHYLKKLGAYNGSVYDSQTMYVVRNGVWWIVAFCGPFY